MKHRWSQRVWLTCLNWAIRARTKEKAPTADAETPDWTHSTSRIGVRFTERLRDLWRPRWLNLHRKDEES